jgi:hypothetical protein
VVLLLQHCICMVDDGPMCSVRQITIVSVNIRTCRLESVITLSSVLVRLCDFNYGVEFNMVAYVKKLKV